MQLNTWLLKTFDEIYSNIMSLSEDVVPKINRFLGFYLDVMKEQNNKKLASSKG